MNILTHRAHCGHQYELWKLNHNFTCVSGLNGISNSWNYSQRPLHEKIKFVNKDSINQKDFDLCIIHFDEFCVNPWEVHRNMGWGDAVKFFLEKIDIPKIAICHGTIRYLGGESTKINNLYNDISIDTETNDLIRNLFKDVLVIVNSNQAHKEWNFNKSKVIYQGFDPLEFRQTSYNKKGFYIPSATLEQRPHYNGYHIKQEVFQLLPQKLIFTDMQIPEIAIQKVDNNIYATENYNNYRNTLASYSFCFNTTLRSPMPRNRGEAMMCGLAIVTTDNHDVSTFIENGINGFYSNDPRELSKHITMLHQDKSLCKRIGEFGRETSIELFHIDRYLKEWNETLEEVISTA